MVLLVTVCVLISAALAAVVVLWQRRAPADGLEHAKALYAAFVSDVERREQRGEVDAELGNEERVEAARALLRAEAEMPVTQLTLPQWLVLVVVGGICFGLTTYTFLIYFVFVGHPMVPDQPYKARLRAWTHAAQANPDDVSPEVLAAVLRQGVDRNSKDPVFWTFLARKDMLAGNAYLAATEFEQAQTLAPGNFTAWSELGEALAFISGGTISGDAKAAFDKALVLDPTDTRAHYYLGRMNLDAGRYDAARTDFTAALSGLAPDDIRRKVVSEQLAAVDVAEKAETA
ncbi:MAG: c-type cytochrome biogenesis protein CcmI, partial [Asticcacaulis sp.]|nr:c-type cytochrome biogenesis protein CcmI [Asticcacaulis sp.]